MFRVLFTPSEAMTLAKSCNIPEIHPQTYEYVCPYQIIFSELTVETLEANKLKTLEVYGDKDGFRVEYVEKFNNQCSSIVWYNGKLWMKGIHRNNMYIRLEIDGDESTYYYMKDGFHFELIKNGGKIMVFQDKTQKAIIKLKGKKPHLIIPKKESVSINQLKEIMDDLISNDMLS